MGISNGEPAATLYINSETQGRIKRLVAKLEGRSVIGLRHSDGTVNKSALLRYLLKQEEARINDSK